MQTIKDVVQQKYGEAALQARGGVKAGCGCGTSACCGPDPITSDLYDDTQAAAIPAEAMLASLGWALIWQSRPALIAALILIPFFHAKARREEQWLRKQFPDYVDYERRVPRFIPRLSRPPKSA